MIPISSAQNGFRGGLELNLKAILVEKLKFYDIIKPISKILEENEES
jgi:hypothetical protein